MRLGPHSLRLRLRETSNGRDLSSVPRWDAERECSSPRLSAVDLKCCRVEEVLEKILKDTGMLQTSNGKRCWGVVMCVQSAWRDGA